MVGSDALTPAQWDAVGLAGRPTFHDARHMVVYGQRTADGRIAFGGRGAPYHVGSRIDPGFDRDERVRTMLVAAVRELFPPLRDVEFPFHWGGPLGVPRDWRWGVRFDRAAGIAVAGGYVGDGVSTTNLAGRTLADLILGRDTELVRLPWVGPPLPSVGARTVALARRQPRPHRRRPRRRRRGRHVPPRPRPRRRLVARSSPP